MFIHMNYEFDFLSFQFFFSCKNEYRQILFSKAQDIFDFFAQKKNFNFFLLFEYGFDKND